VEAQRKGVGPKKSGAIRSSRVESIPSGVILPSPIERNIVQPEAYKKVFDLLLGGGKTPSRFYLGLPDASVRLSILDFQELPGRKKDLEQVIRWQMEKVFLYPLKETSLSFQDLGERKGKRRLLAMAIRNEILAQYEAPLRERGIEPVSVGIASFHLFNLYFPFLLSSTLPEKNFIFFSLADQNFSILICRGGAVDFVRVKELPVQPEGERSGSAPPPWDRILGEIATSLAFYQETGGAPEIHHLFLSGDRPLSQLDEPLRETLQLTPIHLSPEGAGVLSLPGPIEGPTHPLLAAAAAVFGGAD
jgi:Tfp pilus assembly PilM family ATPase